MCGNDAEYLWFSTHLVFCFCWFFEVLSFSCDLNGQFGKGVPHLEGLPSLTKVQAQLQQSYVIGALWISETAFSFCPSLS